LTDPKTEGHRAVRSGGAVLPAHAPDARRARRRKQAAHGDYAANIALALAKPAQRIRDSLRKRWWPHCPRQSSSSASTSPAPGFINIVLTPAARQTIVARVLAERDAFGLFARASGRTGDGRVRIRQSDGPLHVGHGRQAHSATRSGTSLLRRLRG